jgi:ATP-dependent helicase YprA (DUF1998 family)/phage repressor protein C with HTH and peptisase S24 domain
VVLNPVVFTESVVANFLRYQLTTYQFADRDLYDQLRAELSLDATRNTPLLAGPFISLSQPFREGASVDQLVRDGVLHAHMRQIIPYESLRAHQEKAIRAIVDKRSTIVSTGTGSGKTEAFLYPIISRCLQLRDDKAPPGIVAVLVYPMNALAEDQLLRLRNLLAGSGITFGMYVGKTPERQEDVTNERLPAGSSKKDYEAKVKQLDAEKRRFDVSPPEERCSREMMRTQGEQPRILLTNVKMLEYLLTRDKDVELFDNAQLEFLVFDEAHTFSGSIGAETACLIRRIRTFCGRSPDETVCVATSATIVDKDNPDAATEFASRFFGVDENSIVLVREEYEAQLWKQPRISPHVSGDLGVLLQRLLSAIEDPAGSENVSHVHEELTGTRLDVDRWRQHLYEELSANEVVFQLADLLTTPHSLDSAVEDLQRRLKRNVSEEEVLLWLTLGAAARSDDDRPLLRPVMHGFIRGIGGAGVTFPLAGVSPKLTLSIAKTNGSQLKRLDLTTCSTCGQHYFVHHVADFRFFDGVLDGGEAEDDHRVWKSNVEALGGNRVVLIDHLVSDDEDEDDGDDPHRTAPVWFCRHCGALHDREVKLCDGCGSDDPLVKLFAVEQDARFPGYLTRCLSCPTNGRPYGSLYREPARPVRAVDVSDVHVLAQDMIQHSERKRLLLFADNRQDAAFQAGWMRDHARRFRLRALMAEKIATGAISVGDLTHHLDDMLGADEELSRVLVPEVWDEFPKEFESQRHGEQRLRFLRMQVMREIATALTQRVGLEPWGRLKIDYAGLTPALDFIRDYAQRLGVTPERMREGVAALIDRLRRNRLVLDRQTQIYSRIWDDGEREIQRGYLPRMKDVPKGLKLERTQGDNEKRFSFLLGKKENSFTAAIRAWGLKDDDVELFVRELWKLLLDLKLLAPSNLLTPPPNQTVIKGTTGAYQLDVERMKLVENHGVYRCGTCRRAQIRPTPNDRCMAWRCSGKLHFEQEDLDDYNLRVIDQDFEMIRPREHTAMVPPKEREELERAFKGDGQLVNTLVCTPTLELGVDIGALDSVLLRNVPPLPANYWQRTGRAGRRHRMAVNLTYARSRGHDQAYFEHPEKLLGGRVDAPKFNLRNDELVKKHVHSAMLAHLRQLARNIMLQEHEREEIREALDATFPLFVRDYLWDEDDNLRSELFDVSALSVVISKHRAVLLNNLIQIFQQGWPSEAAALVDPKALGDALDVAAEKLQDVIRRVKERLDWSLDQMARLRAIEEKKGTLGEDEDALYRRCKWFVKRLNKTSKSPNLEGFDISYTFNVLASEGYLPGYGLETGTVLAVATVSRSAGDRNFPLPRPKAIALREYVPGNRIYANGYQFTPRTFHFDRQEDEMLFQVDPQRQTVSEVGSASGVVSITATQLRAVPVCDCELIHSSHISDEEEIRFQLPVMILGYEQQTHGGGAAFDWNAKTVQFRRKVDFRLVNGGAKAVISSQQKLGYPICLTCGQTRSPFSSQLELTQFEKRHRELHHTQVWAGFYADITADALSFLDCADRREAYTLAEVLRTAAADILEMDQDDLQILVIGQQSTDRFDAHLYDPMPGGSGLLDQICARFDEVVARAIDIAENCPAECERACIDCLLTFRNAFYHNDLDRHFASDALRALGSELRKTNDIPAKHGKKGPSVAEMPVNRGEARLKLLLERAGFPDPEWHQEIKLKPPLNKTTPDAFYDTPHSEGIAIYLDGLSQHIHGSPATQKRDAEIRAQLDADDFEVMVITATELHDRDAMTRHLAKIANRILGKEKSKDIKTTAAWWIDAEEAPSASTEAVPFELAGDDVDQTNTVPLTTLKAAAGAWGDPQSVEIQGRIRLKKSRRSTATLFVAQIVGHSMEPKIPDNSYGLFRWYEGGSRNGKIVLAQHSSIDDPDTGAQFTVKLYESEKRVTEDTYEHVRIRLLPLNPLYKPIEITAQNAEEVKVIAEFIEVL